MMSDKVDSTAKVVPRPTSHAAEINSPAGKKETAHVGSYEKFTKPAYVEAVEICALLKLDLLENMNASAKFVDGVRGVVCSSSFAKYTIEYCRTALLAMTQKTTILAAEPMLLDPEDTKVAKEMAKVVVVEAYSSTEKIKRLESELSTLKGSNISASTSLQLEIACQEIFDLKNRLDAIQVEYESADENIRCYIP